MSDFRPWQASGEALLVHAGHDQPWNMAVFDAAEGKSPTGLVAMAWGSSPEGVARRAHLIAAAPELYELVADIEESLTADDTYRLLREACRAALAKARGETA